MPQTPMPIHPADVEADGSVVTGPMTAESFEAVTGKCFICRTKGHLSLSHFPEDMQRKYSEQRWQHMVELSAEQKANRASEARVKAKLQQRFK